MHAPLSMSWSFDEIDVKECAAEKNGHNLKCDILCTINVKMKEFKVNHDSFSLHVPFVW